MRVLVVVTHLLGAGHLTRAAVLARGFSQAGHEVLLMSGGFPAPHIDTSDLTLAQLPPVRSDGLDFSTLLNDSQQPITEAWRTARQHEAARLTGTFRPDVVITELYPFGRRQLASEFNAIIDAAKKANPEARIACSIRDILAPPSSAKKARKTTEALAKYDSVFVHSDEAVVPLELSWPVDPAWQHKLRYTGFIAPAPPVKTTPTNEVLVSAGGGAVGRELYKTAAAAARISPLTWRLLVGGSDAASFCAHLMQDAPDNLIAEPNRADFRTLLANASASVSMCGYNTCMDLLQTGTPAVIVPFDDGGETEQSLRAQGLTALGGFTVLPSAQLAAEALVAALDTSLAAPPRATTGINFSGVSEAVRLLGTLKGQHDV
ncbi:glycosyltransferase [Lentibacter algarum]|uniref:glycosyltransferase family protein n=1 Tax=Lentibacter algarum TaxID=576131 RepID=UPI001C06D2D4|nr:glycosyltransferase [Lentibacter algarum]MBU2981385.1 glycosyltransferase [Lentibacter algarum]